MPYDTCAERKTVADGAVSEFSYDTPDLGGR